MQLKKWEQMMCLCDRLLVTKCLSPKKNFERSSETLENYIWLFHLHRCISVCLIHPLRLWHIWILKQWAVTCQLWQTIQTFIHFDFSSSGLAQFGLANIQLRQSVTGLDVGSFSFPTLDLSCSIGHLLCSLWTGFVFGSVHWDECTTRAVVRAG